MSDSETAQSTTEAVAPSQTMLGQSEGTADHAAPAPAGTERPQDDAANAPGANDAETQAAGPYADFTLPEGIDVDPQSLTEAKQLFAADGLSQERAQSYVDLYAAKLKEAVETPYRIWADTQRDWQQAVKADREIGGAKLGSNLAIAAKAVDRFGGEALRQALNISGAGNHPDVVRAFIRIGKAISEDALVLGRGVAHEYRSRADRLYPNDPLKPRD
ncbi:MAG TPA: hypothetical protein VM639_01535 [Dongiaceae bacterium]|nr:hypothetical protein [Dongiaceae bacterium]